MGTVLFQRSNLYLPSAVSIQCSKLTNLRISTKNCIQNWKQLWKINKFQLKKLYIICKFIYKITPWLRPRCFIVLISVMMVLLIRRSWLKDWRLWEWILDKLEKCWQFLIGMPMGLLVWRSGWLFWVKI